MHVQIRDWRAKTLTIHIQSGRRTFYTSIPAGSYALCTECFYPPFSGIPDVLATRGEDDWYVTAANLFYFATGPEQTLFNPRVWNKTGWNKAGTFVWYWIAVYID